MSRGIKVLINTVTWILIGAVLCIAILLAGLRLFGFEIYTVLSGSMEPDIHTGSLVYVKEVEAHALKVGDTITFMAGNNETIVTHRIHSIDNSDGQFRFYTYGINNYDRDKNGNAILGANGEKQYTMDANPVHERNVLGEVKFTVPYLGDLSNYISNPPGMYVAIAFVAVLLLLVFLPDLLFPTDKKGGKPAEAVVIKPAETVADGDGTAEEEQ